MAKINTEADKREFAISTVKQWRTSLSDILNYVEPEIAAIMRGVTVHSFVSLKLPPDSFAFSVKKKR